MAKWKPLQTLALSLQIPFMDKLLEDGLDIDEVDKVIIGKKEAVISHLLRKGASPHVKDKDGATPLHYAVHVGAMQTVKLLLNYNVDVNVADRDGWTPLHIAVQSRNRDIAKVLLINGADKTRKNKDGKTALDLSLCYGKDFKSYDLAKLLKILPADSDEMQWSTWRLGAIGPPTFHTKVSPFSFNNSTLSSKKDKNLYWIWKLKSAEEEETAIPEQEETASAEPQESVSIPVSPSDTLRMYFQADGTLNEAEIPRVTKALEETEGISSLKVQVLEGIGTVELTKQTTVQTTGVASNLVELIQGSGFKLQTLNLSFDGEEDILV
ncbi:hypothetical protein REPUB_Repub10bG0034900 [Reevesia pubescens]